LKITSLTFLFTDLSGSTELYERVGDLVALTRHVSGQNAAPMRPLDCYEVSLGEG
jgi:class 3 adenylate cyclase